MTAGLRLETTNGYTQIDERYSNYYLVSKSSVTVPKATNKTTYITPGVYTFWLNADGSEDDDIIAIARKSDYVNNNKYRLGFLRQKFDASTPNEASHGRTLCTIFSNDYDKSITVDVFKFRKFTSLPLTTNFGLEIYNESGQIVFSSNYKPMRVISSGRSTAIYSSGVSFSLTVPANKTYAVAMPETFYDYWAVGSQRQITYGAFGQYTSESNYVFTSTYVQDLITNQSNRNYQYTDNTKSLLLIDVSNY